MRACVVALCACRHIDASRGVAWLQLDQTAFAVACAHNKLDVVELLLRVGFANRAADVKVRFPFSVAAPLVFF